MKLKMKETLAKILQYLFKCERRTLLWTNPNIEANYDGGTVSLNLSNYDAVDILCYAGGQIVDLLRVPVGYTGKLHEVGGTGGYNSGAITVITRLCTVSNSGVVFTSAYLGFDGQYMTQGFNHNLKPWKIYGIKMGGVLRNPVISRLTAIFTSLLFGGDVNETEAERIVGKGIDPHCRQYLKDRFDCHRIKNLVKHNDSSRRECNCDNKYRKERIQTNYTCRFFDIPRFNSAARDLVAWKQSRLYSQKSYGCFGFETNGCFCDLHQVVAISERRWAA